MFRTTAVMLLGSAALLASSVSGSQEPKPQSPERYLQLGIRQIEDGAFEEAVFSLDTAVRRLEEQPETTGALVEAYLYLGAAYVGLDHEEVAKAKFREALALDPEVRPSEDLFPPRVIELFDEQVLALTVTENKRSGRRFLLLGGAGAAAAVGVAAAVRGSELPDNRDPTATISALPERAIVGVTTVTFSASAEDPDGDALAYSWDLGDGTTASGETVSHVYHSEAAHPVSLTVTDGRGGSTTTQSDFVARTLNGLWRQDRGGEGTLDPDFECSHDGGALACRLVTQAPVGWETMTGSVTDPFQLDLTVHHLGDPDWLWVDQFTGRVWTSLTCMQVSTTRFFRPGADPYGGPGECN